MKFLATSEILADGKTVFTASSFIRGEVLLVSFHGELRVEHPYKYMQPFIDELAQKLPGEKVKTAQVDFSRLDFCNSNGFYAIMDAIELIYRLPGIPVEVKRNRNDDWQQETLPILLNIENKDIASRTEIIDIS